MADFSFFYDYYVPTKLCPKPKAHAAEAETNEATEA